MNDVDSSFRDVEISHEVALHGLRNSDVVMGVLRQLFRVTSLGLVAEKIVELVDVTDDRTARARERF